MKKLWKKDLRIHSFFYVWLSVSETAEVICDEKSARSTYCQPSAEAKQPWNTPSHSDIQGVPFDVYDLKFE